MSENAKSIDTVINEAERLVQVWSENLKLTMSDLTLEGLKLELDKLKALRHSRDEMRVVLSKLVDDTKDQKKVVDAYNTRGKMGMKAVFGPDSAQYGQVGGTRASERKPGTVRKNSKSQQA